MLADWTTPGCGGRCRADALQLQLGLVDFYGRSSVDCLLGRELLGDSQQTLYFATVFGDSRGISEPLC